MGQAFGFGVASAAVTALFEAVFPEKLNTLNGAGPMLAQIAGFEEVAKAALGPLYENAFGKSLEYLYKSVYQPDYPDEADATIWYARGLLGPDDLGEVFKYSGLKKKYEAAYLASAYRPVSPFIMARATASGALTIDDINSVLQFGGYRPDDIKRLQKAFADLAIAPERTAAVNAFTLAAVAGLYSGPDIATELNTLGVIPTAVPFIVKEIGYKRMLKLAELYEKSVSEGYRYGTVTDAEYIPDLENIGLGSDYASARYGVDSILKTGKAANAAAAAAARLANARVKANVKTISEEFLKGATDVAVLTAQLATSGLDPTIAAFLIEYLQAKQLAGVDFAFGVYGTKQQIVLLREKVAAVQQQVQKAGATEAFALATLASLNIPTSYAQALVSAWLAYGQKIIAPI